MYKPNTRYKIQTPSGFQSFKGIQKIFKPKYYIFCLSNGIKIKCSDTHPFLSDGNIIKANQLKKESLIDGVKGKIKIISLQEINESIDLYDLIDVDNGNIFNADGIISHNCSFLTSGNTVIEAEILEYYKKELETEPRKEGFDGSYWKWSSPDYTKQYMTLVDTARGDGEDNSTIQVFDIANCEQVAEYEGQLGTREFGEFAVVVATEWNHSLLVIENTGVGWDVVQTAVAREYKNLFQSPKGDTAQITAESYLNKLNNDLMTPGFTNSTKTRPLLISKLRTNYQQKSIIIHSKRTNTELDTFIWENGKAQAMAGYHDDLIIPIAIFCFLRETALTYAQHNVNLAKASVENIGKSTYDTPAYNAKAYYTQNDPWKIQTGVDQQEDIRWLL